MSWNLALLGASNDALELARAAARDPRFDVCGWFADSAEEEPRLLEAAPRAKPLEDWRLLLSGNEIDAVIVSPPKEAEEELRQEQLRRLTQAGMPLLLIQPACEAILAFELEMIRSDTQSPLLAYDPTDAHPALAELSSMLNAGETSPIGALEQLQFERRLPHRDRGAVLAALVRDAALLRKLAGAASNVNATAAGRDALGSLNVTLTTNQGLLVRWSAAPAEVREEGRLLLVGARGQALLTMPVGGEPWRLQVTGETPSTREFENTPARVGLQQLATALTSIERSTDEQVTNWPEACRDLEVAATVDESLRRGRTIPLHGETASEEQTFKGMMAVGGCGVILLLLLLTFVWAVIEGVRLANNPNQPTVNNQQQGDNPAAAKESAKNTTSVWIRLWPVYPLAVFLLLQLLWLVFLDRPRKKPPAGDVGN